MERFYCLADLMISRQHPVLFTGDVGVGKSALVEVNFSLSCLFRYSLWSREYVSS